MPYTRITLTVTAVEPGDSTMELFKPPLYDLVQFGKQRCGLSTHTDIRVWNVTVLARDLAQDYPLLMSAARAVDHRGEYRHSSLCHLGRYVLGNQLKRLRWKSFLWWIPVNTRDLSWALAAELDTLSNSLLATAIKYRVTLSRDHLVDYYSHGLLSHGLAWGCLCLEHEGGLNRGTKFPELDVAEVNGALSPLPDPSDPPGLTQCPDWLRESMEESD